MKFTKILLGVLFSIFLMSSVSAIEIYGDWEDGNQIKVIDEGETASFFVDYFSMNPPMNITIKLIKTSSSVPIYIFENNLIVSNNFFEKSYSLDKSNYLTSGNFEVILTGSDKLIKESFVLYLVVNKVPVPENSAPRITSLPPLEVNENSKYEYQIKAEDDDGDKLTYYLNKNPSWLSVSSNGLVSGTAPMVSKDENFEIKIAVSDGKNQTTQEYTLIVRYSKDLTPPVITLNGDETEVVDVFSNYIEKGATAIDNVDGDLTDYIAIIGSVNTSILGEYEIKYSVRDNSGNLAEKIRKVKVVDRVSPVITLIGPLHQKIYLGDPYIELGATAFDNYDGDLTSSIYIKQIMDNRELGIYEVRYMVKDSSGNSAMEIRTVEIIKRPSSGGGGMTILEEEKKESKEKIPEFIPKYNQTIYSLGLKADYDEYDDYDIYWKEVSCCKKIWFAILRFVRWIFGL